MPRIRRTNNAIAIDTETTGPYLNHGCKPFMVTACDEEGDLFKWEFRVNPKTREPAYSRDETVNDIFNKLNEYDTWIFHNALFDLKALSLFGNYDLTDAFDYKDIHDTMLMAHCHNSLDRLGLKGLAFQYLGFPEEDEKELDKAVVKARRIAKRLGWAIASEEEDSLKPLKDNKPKCDFWLPAALCRHFSSLDPHDFALFRNVCSTYAKGDVERTMGLYLYFKSILKSRGHWKYYDQNRMCLIPTYRMQNRGFYLKTRKIPSILSNLDQTKEKLRKGMQNLCRIREFNPRSPIQLRKALFDVLGLEAVNFTEKGNPSTDKDAVKDFLSYPDLGIKQTQFLRRLQTYRKVNTAISYLESYVRHEINHRLYPNMNPVGTITVRYACKDPNTQNISKQETEEDSYELTETVNLREAFGPPRRKIWVCIDYAQLQLRIFAHACEDQFLIDSFAQGNDIHDTVAREVFQTEEPSSLQRRAAKAINFGIIFGAGRNRIERMSGIDGSYDMFRARFPLVQRYLRRCEQLARKQGYVQTLGGYPLRVPRKTAYKACNLVVQGTEGELVKDAINECENYCNREDVPFKIIMTIHDELIFESKESMTLNQFDRYREHLDNIMDLMNLSALKVGVVTEVDFKITDSTWASAHELSV